MAQVIRLSPSGPPLRGDNGGMAEPGTGFQLRLDEAQGSTAMGALTTSFQPLTDLGGTPLEVKLESPAPNKRYKFNSHFEVTALSPNDASVSVRAMVSYDGGATRANLGENVWQLRTGTAIRAGIDIAMALGSELDVPVPAGAPEISILIEAKTGQNNEGQVPNGGKKGTIWLSLAELL